MTIKFNITKPPKKINLLLRPENSPKKINLSLHPEDSRKKAEYLFPTAPPSAWFAKNDIREPHGVKIDESGRIYGYLCSWNSTHIASQFAERKPPRSSSDYAWFHVGQTLTEEGDMIKTGVLTADTYHPALDKSPEDVHSHYDHTGCGVADVVAYEDNYGIQIAGALRPDVTLAQARMLRASDYSPDWRPVARKGFMRKPLEMVAIMACNLSGFVTNALVAPVEIPHCLMIFLKAATTRVRLLSLKTWTVKLYSCVAPVGQ